MLDCAGASGRADEIIAVSRDVSERVRAGEALRRSEGRHRYLAFHDALTGLPNRAALLAGYGEGAHAVESREAAVAEAVRKAADRGVILYENDLPDHYP